MRTLAGGPAAWLAWLWAGCLAPLVSTVACTAAPELPRRHLLIVVDGLRPDYVTADVMPNLTALGRRGVVFRRHHSAYPTVTRVNAASFSTGAYPEAHGLLGNAVYLPRVDAARFLDTADRHVLSRIAEIEGALLTATPLGDVLRASGRRMLVVSSGSSGSAVLNNHTVAGGAILHHEFTQPGELGAAMQAIGPVPAKDAPRTAFDRYAVDAFLKVGIPRIDPSVTVLWLGALDGTAHANGIGHDQTVAVLRTVDAEIARVQEGLAERGLLDDYDIWVSSDHGFSTHTGAPDVAAALEPFLGTLSDGTPRIVAGGGAIYVRDDDAATVAGIVRRLQQTEGVGAIFTRAVQPGSLDGVIPGTLSFDAVRWQHARAAQILYSPDWTDAANPRGVRGTAAAGGTAGHGSASPWDIHNTLTAAGPDLQRGAVVDVPSANVDLAPTFLGLLGLPRPASMQGRVLREAFVDQGAADSRDVPRVETRAHTTRTPDGAYVVTATLSTVSVAGHAYRYFDGAARSPRLDALLLQRGRQQRGLASPRLARRVADEPELP